MEDLQTQSGLFIIKPDGTMQASGNNPMALAGESDETNYQIQASVTIVTGSKAGLIVYGNVECMLDFQNNLVSVGNVTKSYILSSSSSYDLRVICREKDIYFFVNGVNVIKTTVSPSAGEHGFKAYAAVADVTFSKVFYQTQKMYIGLQEALNEIQSIDYKDIVGKNGTLQAYYDYIHDLIVQISSFIDGETDREAGAFQNGGITTVDTFDGDGRKETFFLNSSPVLSILKVEENLASIGSEDNWVTYDTIAYRSSKNKVIFGYLHPCRGTQNFKITYTAGYQQTPSPIKRVVARLIKNIIHKDIADKTGAYVAFSKPQGVNFVTPDILTSDLKAILNKYKAVGYGEM